MVGRTMTSTDSPKPRYETENIHVGVKTVNPRTDNSDANWQKQLDRCEHWPENVHYIVDKEWLGAREVLLTA